MMWLISRLPCFSIFWRCKEFTTTTRHHHSLCVVSLSLSHTRHENTTKMLKMSYVGLALASYHHIMPLRLQIKVDLLFDYRCLTNSPLTKSAGHFPLLFHSRNRCGELLMGWHFFLFVICSHRHQHHHPTTIPIQFIGVMSNTFKIRPPGAIFPGFIFTLWT